MSISTLLISHPMPQASVAPSWKRWLLRKGLDLLALLASAALTLIIVGFRIMIGIALLPFALAVSALFSFLSPVMGGMMLETMEDEESGR